MSEALSARTAELCRPALRRQETGMEEFESVDAAVEQGAVSDAAPSASDAGELMLNPHVEVQRLREGNDIAAYRILAPIRGRGRLNTRVEHDGSEMVAALHAIVEGTDDVELSESVCERLAELGVLVYEHEIGQPVTFRCGLADAAALSAPVADAGALVVAPRLELTSVAQLVAQQPELEEILEPSDALVLVTDALTGARLPYWLDEHELALVQRLTPGAPPPRDIDPAILAQLVGAGIVVDGDAAQAAQARLDAAGAQLAHSGYARLPRMLPPLQIAAMAYYYRRLVVSGFTAASDVQVPLRSARYNEPLLRYYQRELAPFISRVQGAAFKPSFGYFASYRRGATLKKHTDRPQCALTASLLLDFAGGSSTGSAWPLYLELPASGDQVSIALDVGDAVLFRGCELPHYREPFDGERSASYFLHYVDEAFTGDLD
ncbi:MAG TPA: hypothetical protein VHB97_20115 [Polyangia bacterium]|nr:hypothetical protein [Polyangia bacterium]